MSEQKNEEQIIPLKGRIDSGNAAETEEKIFAAWRAEPDKTPVFEALALEYISSAGLRVLMKVRKTAGEALEIRNVSPEIYEILEMTGFTELFRVKKRMREISVEGCEVIGRGFYGTVYRLDADTIVKVYRSPDSIALIENERKMARTAFVKGIPTAISYDIVRVGDSYGSVFELLKSQTLNEMLIAQPERAEEIIRDFAALMKKVHAVSMAPGELPSAREAWLGYLEDIHGRAYIGEAQYVRLKALLAAVPETGGIVHGDLHMKNVMLAEGEPMLIDMDTLTQGDPVFDLQGVYVTYQEYGEDDPNNTRDFLGIEPEMGDLVWRKTLEFYFDTTDPERLSRLADKIRLVAAVRFLWLNAGANLEEGELGALRLRHTREHIGELLERVDSLLLE